MQIITPILTLLGYRLGWQPQTCLKHCPGLCPTL